MATATSNSVVLPPIDGGNGSLHDEFINGLVQGGSWLFSGPRTLTYSFNLNDDGAYPGGAPNPGSGGAWSSHPQIQAAVAQALGAWSSVANISFQEVTSGTYYFQSTADLSFTLTGTDLQNSAGAVALGFFPDPIYTAGVLAESGYNSAQFPNMEGNIFLDNLGVSPLANSVAAGSQGFWVILHEIGHALGLKHPFDDGGNVRPLFSALGISEYDAIRYTVMTYESSVGYAVTPMLLDILALQAIYGANMNHNAGNTTYTLNTAGHYQTFWDAGGIDVIDASGVSAPNGLVIDLGEGAFSGGRIGERTNAIAYGVLIENAIGSSRDDSIFGNAAANNLVGGNGADSLVGRGGQDTLIGGAGDDLYEIASSSLVLEGLDSGQDLVMAWVNFLLPDNVESLRLLGSEGLSGDGNAMNNSLYGNFSDNFLSGNEGNDYLDGGSGNDTLDGGSGQDYMVGGLGADFFLIDDANDIVTDAPQLSVVNIALSSVSYTLNANGEFIRLVLAENGSINATGGSVGNWLQGNSSANVLDGKNGADTLVGSGGIDVLIGGNGNDVFIVTDNDDSIVEYLSEGIDAVLSSASFALPNNVENLTLTGTADVSAQGNSLNNVLTGNSASNFIDGGAGIDSMMGGGGDDTYVVDAYIPNHSLSIVGQPNEIVSNGGTYSIDGAGGIFSVLLLNDITGDGLIDRLAIRYQDALSEWGYWILVFSTHQMGVNLAPGTYSDAQIDSFYTGAGFPGMTIRSGYGLTPSSVYGNFVIHDIEIDYSGLNPVLLNFEVDFEQRANSPTAPKLTGTLDYDPQPAAIEAVIELSGEGNDKILSSVSATLPDHVEILTLTGSNNLQASGNSAANILSGNSGNNKLDGAGGADIIAGGTGNDTYVVDNSGDQVMELANSGNDDIQSAVSYDLMQAWHVEHLTLTGGSAINGRGNWLDNVINGNSAANRLEGNRGQDTLNGAGGNDSLAGGQGDDSFYFDAYGAPTADTILDFQAGADNLLFSQTVFTALGGAGSVAAGRIQIGLSSQINAASGNAGDGQQDVLKYATDTGQLYYDADGNGAGGLSLIATLHASSGTPIALLSPDDLIAV